jgi:malate dehydrogenase (oxaloacetate-decarboxylating)
MANIVRVALRGHALLNDPHWNKGTAFTEEERKQFGLIGRLPYQVNTLDEQCQRAHDQLLSFDTPLRKNSFLQSLKEQNTVLFYQLLRRHLRELMPIIYTPTEADAIANYSHLFRRSEGLYLTFDNQHSMEEDFLEQTRGRDIDLIVCSDAEAILGIGDQGVGGIGISTAKSALYTLLAGINPTKSLPVILDVGTNSESLFSDPLYVGWRHERVRGDAYDQFIDKFVQLVRKYLPHCLLHFEDFGVTNAQRLLEIYRDKHAIFNDDVQGTGAVTLAAVMSAVGVTRSSLADQRYVIYGAGSAGLGIAHQLRDGIVQIDSVPANKANDQFYLIDKHGLIKKSLGDLIRPALQDFVRPNEEWEGVPTNEQGEITLLEVVRKVKPTVLIGCSTHAGAFTEEVVREMAKHVDRPIILPLSNPSRLVEVDPAKANDWTNGKALLATGSPFPPAKVPSGKDYIIAECNNALLYPGLGFGAVLAKARLLTDSMILAGAQRLASLSPALKDPDDALLPDFADAPSVNFEIAVAVAEQAIAEGIANVDWNDQEVRENAKRVQWLPVYEEYVYDENGEK